MDGDPFARPLAGSGELEVAGWRFQVASSIVPDSLTRRFYSKFRFGHAHSQRPVEAAADHLHSAAPACAGSDHGRAT